MKRSSILPRPNWQDVVTRQGLVYHTAGGVPYWDESVHYSFSKHEVLELERASRDLHALCLQAVQHVIDERRYDLFHVPAQMIPLIERSWNEEWPAIYGRFDLAYDGRGLPKLLEYNADTPTSLFEAAVVQWHWFEDVFGGKASGRDQWTSIHDRLVEKWRALRPFLRSNTVHFAHADDDEDRMTVEYLADTAQQAGLAVVGQLIGDIGWHHDKKAFVDLAEAEIRTLFKLYPWEWLAHEAFGELLPHIAGKAHWIEPPWKMILSNKAILAVLWERFPGHPLLLETHVGAPCGLERRGYVKKPLLSREGQNVTIVNARAQTLFATDGEYGEEGFVYQALAPLPEFDGKVPVLGCWMIDDEPAGMGIRESDGPITDDTSRFVPHVIER